jgi:hypothetical protein
VRQPESKPKTHTCYRLGTRVICLPWCQGCTKKPDCGAGCGECGKPREVRVLIKRFVKEDRCEMKCVPVQAPCAPAYPAPCTGPVIMVHPAK